MLAVKTGSIPVKHSCYRRIWRIRRLPPTNRYTMADKQWKNKSCGFAYDTLLPCTIFRVDRRRLGSAKVKSCGFAYNTLLPCTIFRVDRRRLGSAKVKSCGFAYNTLLPCTIFRVDRRRLGSAKVKSYGFAFSLRSPCTIFANQIGMLPYGAAVTWVKACAAIYYKCQPSPYSLNNQTLHAPDKCVAEVIVLSLS